MSEPKSREGTQFGPYRLRRLIGKGGMGEVYEAEDTVKDRVVALKLLPEGMSHDPVFRKRLQREAHSAGRLQEPHVVPIHDYGEIDGVLYVDMRMISGSDLRKLLKSYGPMTPARAVAIIRQVASALDAAHESGIMHRDVKPENILVTREDFAYLVDFGIANAASDEKLTELGTAVGTYAYMAPERFQGDEVTFRADIYALACVLHECLTGSQPYGGDSVSVVITAHLMQPVPRPSVERPGIPAAFDQVIARGMAKKPDERFSSAGAMAMAATQALTESDKGHAETIVQPARQRRRPRCWTRAPPWPLRPRRLPLVPRLRPHPVTRPPRRSLRRRGPLRHLCRTAGRPGRTLQRRRRVRTLQRRRRVRTLRRPRPAGTPHPCRGRTRRHSSTASPARRHLRPEPRAAERRGPRRHLQARTRRAATRSRCSSSGRLWASSCWSPLASGS